MKKYEIIIFILIILLSIAAIGITRFVMKDDSAHKTADLYINGKVIKTLSLEDTKVDKILDIKTNRGKIKVKAVDGGVNIIGATCPDQICVNDGFIDKPGELLVCLPNKFMVEIKGNKNLDASSL